MALGGLDVTRMSPGCHQDVTPWMSATGCHRQAEVECHHWWVGGELAVSGRLGESSPLHHYLKDLDAHSAFQMMWEVVAEEEE